MKSRGLVAIANEQVPIATVCRLLGVEVPDDGLRAPKLHCPFEHFFHSDGGMEAAMRIFADDNTAYCFSCTVKYTPVSLYAQGMDVVHREAAVRLLEYIGYTPPDLATAWQLAVTFEPMPQRSQLAEALKTFCRRVDPGWRTRQFDPVIAAALRRCFALLDLVHSGADAQLWLERCKIVMSHALDLQKPS